MTAFQHSIPKHLPVFTFIIFCHNPLSHYLAGLASSEKAVIFILLVSYHPPPRACWMHRLTFLTLPLPKVTCDGLLPGSTRFWHAHLDSLGWPWQTGWDPQGPGGLPGCSGSEMPPGSLGGSEEGHSSGSVCT